MRDTLTPSRVERLEPRRLFAATYAVGPLTGYTFADADWSYECEYALGTNIVPVTNSGKAEMSISIDSAGSGAARKFTRVTTCADDAVGDAARVYQADAQGLNLVKLTFAASSDSPLIMKFAGLRLTPAAAALGQTYADTGKLTGTVITDLIDDYATKGALTGTAATTFRLDGPRSTTTPAGTFSAVKGTQLVTVTGSIRVAALGTTYNIPVSGRFSTTFWAVKNVGIVRQTETSKLILQMGSRKPSVTLTTNARLTSHVIHRQAAVKHATPRNLFSTKPVLDSLPSTII